MPEVFSLGDLIEAGFTLEVSRYPDIPVSREDRVLYADRRTGRLLIARAPVVFAPERARRPGGRVPASL